MRVRAPMSPVQIPDFTAKRFPVGRALAAALLLSSSYVLLSGTLFRIKQNEVGYVTRFGKVQNAEKGPLQPGLHFKVPVIDDADEISTSTDTVKIPAMKAFTRDTQEVMLQISITYNVPPASAYHLMYEVGRSGNVDIGHNLEAITNDRVRSIVSRRDVTEMAGEGREKIVEEIKTMIASELKRLFRVEVQDVQIPMLDFSPQYKEAVNRSTLARAQRLQAEQDRERARVEAETVVVKAKGDADSQYARAEGQARSNLTQAKGEAESHQTARRSRCRRDPCQDRSRRRHRRLHPSDSGSSFAQLERRRPPPHARRYHRRRWLTPVPPRHPASDREVTEIPLPVIA